MATTLKVGDKVGWNSSGGHSTGKVTKVYKKDFEWHSQTHRASEDDPMYEVESDKSGDRAVHKASALSKK